MKVFHDSTDNLTARQQVHQLARLRMEVLAHNLAAVLILGGAVWLAWYTASWYPLALLPVAGYMALKARFLADGLPKRDTPSWQRRLALWVADRLHRRRLAKVKSAKPYRHIRVAGAEDAIKIPLSPGEARHAKDKPVIHTLTAADVYAVVSLAYEAGLSERAVDKHGLPVWRWEEGRRLGLPSGRYLTRGAFRALQAWLVDQGFAGNDPYRFVPGFRPEQVLERLNAL